MLSLLYGDGLRRAEAAAIQVADVERVEGGLSIGGTGTVGGRLRRVATGAGRADRRLLLPDAGRRGTLAFGTHRGIPDDDSVSVRSGPRHAARAWQAGPLPPWGDPRPDFLTAKPTRHRPGCRGRSGRQPAASSSAAMNGSAGTAVSTGRSLPSCCGLMLFRNLLNLYGIVPVRLLCWQNRRRAGRRSRTSGRPRTVSQKTVISYVSSWRRSPISPPCWFHPDLGDGRLVDVSARAAQHLDRVLTSVDDEVDDRRSAG